MKIFLIPNPDKNGSFDCAVKAAAILKEQGHETIAEEQFLKQLSCCKDISFADFASAAAGCDLCIPIGGDGTIIHSAKQILPFSKPILGINMGRVGFLAYLEPSQLELLTRLGTGGYRIEERMLLKAVRENGEEYLALNDLVISRGASSRMIDVEICCDGKPVDEYRCDGMIASTPTGSTAYSLSAGGPILDPTMDSILLTPISPYSLYNRSIVFHPASVLTVTVRGHEGQIMPLSADGETDIPLLNGETVTISRTEDTVKLINLTDKRFYEILTDKLRGRSSF